MRSARQQFALLRMPLVPLRPRGQMRCMKRRVAGARRPNLCASLACEKRHNSQAMSVDRHPDRIASTQRGVCAGGAVTLRGVTASAGYHSCHGYFSGVSLTPWRAHMGTSGAPDPCDDMPAREAGRPVAGIERYKAIAVRAGHPATWAEGLAGPMGRSTHRDARRWPDEQGCLIKNAVERISTKSTTKSSTKLVYNTVVVVLIQD